MRAEVVGGRGRGGAWEISKQTHGDAVKHRCASRSPLGTFCEILRLQRNKATPPGATPPTATPCDRVSPHAFALQGPVPTHRSPPPHSVQGSKPLENLPDDVIVVPQVKFLLVLAGVVHNSHAGDEIDNLLGGRVVQVVAALMSPVSVDPLQSQVAIGGSSVSHGRALPVCRSRSLSRSLSDNVSFTKKDLCGGFARPLLQPNSRLCRSSAELRISGHLFESGGRRELLTLELHRAAPPA